MTSCMVVIFHTGNGDRSIPGGDGEKENDSSENFRDTSSQKNYRINLDWREFRAKLYTGWQVMFYFPEGLVSSETKMCNHCVL